MQYDELTEDEVRQILTQRKKQYQVDHLNHSLNVELLRKSGASDEQTLAQVRAEEAAIEVLEDAHAIVVEKLAAKPGRE